EVLSSAFLLEPYGYHLFALNFSGPLKKINKGLPEERSILGYFISAEFETQQDARPSAVGVWMLNDDVYNDIRQNPYRPGLFGTGVNQNAEFIRSNDMTLERVRPNAGQNRISVAGKVDFQPNNAIS